MKKFLLALLVIVQIALAGPSTGLKLEVIFPHNSPSGFGFEGFYDLVSGKAHGGESSSRL